MMDTYKAKYQQLFGAVEHLLAGLDITVPVGATHEQLIALMEEAERQLARERHVDPPLEFFYLQPNWEDRAPRGYRLHTITPVLYATYGGRPAYMAQYRMAPLDSDAPAGLEDDTAPRN